MTEGAEKGTEAELAVVRERLDLALEGADLGIWDWDLATGLVLYDSRWKGMLGYGPDEMEPNFQTWKTLMHPDDWSRVWEIVDAHLQGKTERLELEHRLRHRDGSWVWVLSRGKVSVRDESGAARRVTGTHLNITPRKIEELARRAAEEQARQRAQEMEWLLKSMSSAFVVWRTELDAEGNLKDFYFDYFNDAYERISGVTLEQVRGKSVHEVWPDTEQSWYDVYGEIARTGNAKCFEMFHAPTRGLYACNAYCPPNLKERICVVFEDITEQNRTLNELRALMNQQRAILDAAPVGICFVKNTHFEWLNRQLAFMLGHDISQLVAAHVSVIYLKNEDFERVRSEAHRQLPLGGGYSAEVLLKKQDGTPLWCQLTGQAIDAGDLTQGSIWTMNDITERRQAEMALRESELRFKQLVLYSNDVIAVSDRLGQITSLSDSVSSILGYQPEKLVGSPTSALVHPEDQVVWERFYRSLLERPRKPQRVEYSCRHQNGKWIPVEVVGTNLLEEPSVRGIVLNMRDVSERRLLTEQLQQAMKMEAVGRLAGGVAHDFNNLLSVISGNIELAILDIESNGPIRVLLDEAASGAARAAALTRQLLAFSRRQFIEPRVVNLNELVGELRRLLERVIGEDVVLTTHLADDLGMVRVDPGQIERVIVNLAVNARDAMPEGGSLVLGTCNVELDADYQRLHPEVVAGPYVQLSVSDTGHGMEAHVRERLFEPFFTTKPKGQGTGLGLATIYGMVQQAGGNIEVESRVNQGSSFKLNFPRVEAEPERLVRDESTAPVPTGSETVLLVEDEESVRQLNESILRRLGYRVLVAGNASEALKVAQDHTEIIHLLLTDVVMPGMNGRELAGAFAGIHPESKVLFASGYAEDIVVYHGVVDGDTHFIAKPFSLQALAAKIRAVLSKA